mmetsp:Transcript_10480/g.28695  ORF Transcript_10480/g.28695 Transcript_10480/m.28695 type:complete len:419 (+) Transcript_10480:87-1343(+)
MGSSASKYTGDKPKNLVIVGAGYAGMGVARALAKDPAFDGSITVVDPRESLHHNLGFLRAAADPRWTPNMLVPRSIAGVTHQRAEVTSVTDEAVTCDDGSVLPYDYLVFATGSDYNSPGKLPMSVRTDEEAKAYLARVNEAIKKASKITIVGGGPVGCELAGELTEVVTGKEVTLIHSGPHLFNTSRGVKPKMWEKTEAIMKAAGVNVIFNERVEGKPAAAAGGAGESEGKAAEAGGDAELLASGIQVGPTTLTTDKGTTVEADLVFWCGGARVRSGAFAAFLGDAGVDKRGRAMVDGYFRCKAKADGGRVFAVGDCQVGPEAEDAKLFNANNQCAFLAKVLAAAARGKTTDAELGKAYKVAAWEGLFAPYGPKDGVAQLPNGMVMGSGLASMKGGDFFYGRTWKEQGNKTAPPKPGK